MRRGPRVPSGAWGPELFDNCIGRKRDVGGVVLASAFGRELKGREKESTTVTFQGIALLAFRLFRTVGRRAFGLGREADAYGTRQESRRSWRGSPEPVTSRDEILVQLESLILAQNERWRQA